HDFHHEWISSIKRALNGGLLPPGYYAMAEQIAGELGPDVLTLDMTSPRPTPPEPPSGTGLALATRPPQLRFRAEADAYPRTASVVAIRHTSVHRVVAMVELASPGNKASRSALEAFARKAREALDAGIQLLIIALFPPGPRDHQGIHQAIWDGGPEG